MADFRHPTVRLVLLSITLGTILITTLLPVAFFEASARTTLKNEAITRTAFMAGRLAETLRYPLWYVAEQQCRQIVEIEMQNRDVAAILLYDEFDKLIFAFQRSPETEKVEALAAPDHKSLEKLALASLDLPISMNEMIIGRIVVYSSMLDTGAMHRNSSRLSMILAIGTSLFVALILFWATEQLLTRKILAMVKVLRAFENKDYSVRAPTDGMEELQQLALSFNDMAQTIQTYNTSLESLVEERTARLIEAEKLAFLGSMVAGLAHEVNTPLGVGITAASQAGMLARRLQSSWEQNELSERFFQSSVSDIIEAVDIISGNLGRANDFIRSFKTLASDQSVDDSRPIRLADYIHDIILSLKPSLKKTGHSISVHCDPDLVIEIVPGLIYQILSNLIMNALLHAYDDDQAGQMTIDCSVEPPPEAKLGGESQLTLVFSDNGRGIDASIANQIFEPFFTTRKNRGGTGLGLYIIKSISLKNGGTITYTPVQPHGSRFTIHLPCTKRANGDQHDAFRL